MNALYIFGIYVYIRFDFKTSLLGYVPIVKKGNLL